MTNRQCGTWEKEVLEGGAEAEERPVLWLSFLKTHFGVWEPEVFLCFVLLFVVGDHFFLLIPFTTGLQAGLILSPYFSLQFPVLPRSILCDVGVYDRNEPKDRVIDRIPLEV